MFDTARHLNLRGIALVVFVLLSSGWHSSRGQKLDGEGMLQKQVKKVVRHQPNPQPLTNSHLSRRAGKPKADIENLIALGNKARDEDNYQQALDYYGRALKLNPKEARAHYGIGNIYSDQRCSDRAIEAYNNALKNDPKYAAAYRGLASVYSAEKLYEQAIRHLKTALDIKPDDFIAKIALGWAYIEQDNFAEAAAHFKSLLNSPTQEKRALGHALLGFTSIFQKNYQAAIEHSQKAVSLAPARQTPLRDYKRTGRELEPEEIVSLSLGLSYMTLYWSYTFESLYEEQQVGSNATKALEALKLFVLIFPAMPEGHINLGSSYASQHRFKEAIQEVEQGIQLRESGRVKSKPGALQCAAGKHEDQKDAAEDFIALGDVFLAQAELEKEQKSDDKAEEFYGKAIEQYQKALSLDGESPSAYRALGAAYRSQDEYENAIEQFKKALLYLRPEEMLNDDTETSLNFNLAEAYFSNEDFDDAILPLQRVLQLNQQHPTMWISAFLSSSTPVIRFMLGYCFYKTGQYAQALELASEIAQSAPNFIAGRYLLGLIHYEQKRYGDAIALLEGARRLDVDSVEAISWSEVAYALGDSYRQTGRYQEAVSEFEKILSRLPFHTKARYGLGLSYVQLKDKPAALKQYQQLKENGFQQKVEGSNKTQAQDLLDKIDAMR